MPASASATSSRRSLPSPFCAVRVACRTKRYCPTPRQNHDEDKRQVAARTKEVEAEVFTFFSFPPELRNMIYEYSLHYPDSRQLYAPYYRSQLAAARHEPPIYTPWAPRLRPQTILLLNKRITSECLPMLKSRTLVIDRLPPPRALSIVRERAIIRRCASTRRGDPEPFHHFMHLSDFISPRTLQSIAHIDINVGLCEGPLGSGWAWMPIVDELLEILKQRNICAKLRLILRLCNTTQNPILWHSDKPYLGDLIKKFEKFALDNPNVFAQREIKADIWMISAQKAWLVSSEIFEARPRVKVQLLDGSEMELDEDGNRLVKQRRPPPSELRVYPDKEIFPGSVMQFAKPFSSLYYLDEDEY
ncbi:unnamed protein product [Discula destructiva]